MLIEVLEKVVTDNKNRVNFLLLRNLLKERLQFHTLNFIYNSRYGKSFLFKGGTCLRFCFDLPRLSEDLDFDIINWENFSLKDFTHEMEKHFKEILQFKEFSFKITGNKKEIFLQFPVMQNLGLVNKEESDKLFLRVDISPLDSKYYQDELSVKFTSDVSFVIKRYSLEDLFASKIAAIIQRTFRKGKGDLITFKGRDYFDLIWFLEKGVVPNWKRALDITGFSTKKKLFTELDKKVAGVKEEYLKEDLLPLFQESNLVVNFTDNFKKIYKSYRGRLI